MNRPFAESAEQNKAVIFDAIEPYLRGQVLEIGSGTGQHAVYFAARINDLRWQPSDLAQNLAGIRGWVSEAGLDNVAEPIELDVLGEWPQSEFDTVYTANTFHIMSAAMVAQCMAGVGRCLRPGGAFAVYGPFNYAGRFTSESNARFDAMLRARDPDSGIRDIEWLEDLAGEAGLELIEDLEMPVNNRTIIWQKRT